VTLGTGVLRSALTGERGSVAVEFALVVPVVLLVLLAAVEVAVVARAQLEVVHAAREGAREAAASPDPARAVAAAQAALGAAGSGARISVQRPHVVGATAEVEVWLPHQLGAGLFAGPSITLRGRAVMRVEQ
jgi:Flp pilus assembly protein TadG